MTVQDDILCQVAERAAAEFEGFKIEVVGGQIVMTPRSDVQSWTILDVQMAAMSAGIDKGRLLSDVLLQFPGEPPRVPDVTILEDGAVAPYAYGDALAAIEIVSTKDDDNDYAVKLRQYARFGVPTYLVIDPFRGECTLLTRPKGDGYAAREVFAYGETVTLRLSDGSSVAIPTDGFKRKS
ncbi:Uma2 family endonuclease [Streptomyces sp. H27-D2]|uniref:Uma2 family endonuclease n=1 Tax=Streptomyces sp. H27-D2 TaxID=3046304 RepID=UPI002DB56AAE|nr:Uma2 family endonuclease [Streptomyces sp. H27-D2]MEC4017060.1 Uma2 family endonuclease [Streptomyces sp. H27-D2]